MVLPMILKWVILMQILHCNVKQRHRLPAFPQRAFFSVAGAGADAAKNKFARPQLEQKDSQCLYFIIYKSHSFVNQRHIFRLLQAGEMPVLHHHQGRFFLQLRARAAMFMREAHHPYAHIPGYTDRAGCAS